MATLQITAISSPQKENKSDALAKAIESKISENDRFKVNNESWMVKFEGTPRELSLFLGVQGGALGGVLISNISSISGYGPMNLNTWFKSHSDGENHGEQ